MSEVLADPSRLARGLEEMLERERPSSAGDDEALWLKKISEIEGKQERLLNLHLDGDITTAQFRTKSVELKEARTTLESHTETARSRIARLEAIERDKDALI